MTIGAGAGFMLDIDRNLLFAVIALQDDYIDQSQFAEVCSGWTLRFEGTLPDLLVERGWVTPAEREEVERKIERKLKRFAGDVNATLAAVADTEARELIQNMDDPGLSASLATIAPANGHVRVETRVEPTAALRSRYVWNRLYAEGGLGRVWIARDLDLNREVALKEIKPGHADHAEARRRFFKEAQVTGQLEHPNIVPVYELARRDLDGRPFYTMRFVRGRTMRQAIAEFHARRMERKANPLARLKLLQAFVSVCQAVGYAHSRGVVHRDLKPENVALGGFGEVILLDWGLAKLVALPGSAKPGVDIGDTEADDPEALVGVSITEEALADATMIGQRLGTPAYMAPEQAEGRLDLVDARTDIYGLGAILFEILTGRPPHEGKTSVEVLKRITEAQSSPKARDSGVPVPAALDAICARAMARDREARYASAADLAEEIQRWLADEPVSAYPEWFGRRAWRWGRKHPWVVRAIGLVTAFLITVFLLSFMLVASVALIWVPLGAVVGTLVGVFKGHARRGARRGAMFGFRIGLVIGFATFFAFLLFEIIEALVMGHRIWPLN
jgi:tRNA A-37 threonylcarbamoyl transferase component Bud32